MATLKQELARLEKSLAAKKVTRRKNPIVGKLTAASLNNGGQYRIELDEDNRLSVHKEHGAFMVRGFKNGKHFSKAFSTLAEVKPFVAEFSRADNPRSKTKRTPAQIAATKKMLAANAAKRKPAKRAANPRKVSKVQEELYEKMNRGFTVVKIKNGKILAEFLNKADAVTFARKKATELGKQLEVHSH